MQSLGIRSKTDSIDGKGVARMGAEEHLPACKPITQGLYQLRGLSRHLETLQNTKAALNNHLEAINYSMYTQRAVATRLQARVETLAKEVGKIKEHIEQELAKEPMLSWRVGHLR